MLTTQLGYGGAETSFIRLANFLAQSMDVTVALFSRDYAKGAYASGHEPLQANIVLLDAPQTATVRAVTEVDYFVIDNAIEVLRSHPDWLLQIARLLAQRVNATTAQLTRDRDEHDAMVLPQNFMSSWGDPTV